MSIGGTELNAVRVAERLDRDEFDLSVACLRDDGPLAARYAAAGIRVDTFPIGSLFGRKAIREGARLRAMLRRERVDVVHAHDRYANVFAIPWARAARTPAIASRRWGTQIGTAHRVANALVFRLADRVLANSDAVAAALVREDRVPPARVVVVPNFVDDQAFERPAEDWLRARRAELRLEDGGPVIGIVANLRPVKDHATLLRAVAELKPTWPELVLVLVGDGESAPALRALAAELGITEAVRFAGQRANVPNLHWLFDVSVLCSTSEGFPNTLVEAMAAARPVVATAVGGVLDAVVDGETGLLVPAGDPGALARAIDRLLGDDGLRHALGTAGAIRARERFSAQRVLPTIAALYRRLAGEARA